MHRASDLWPSLPRLPAVRKGSSSLMARVTPEPRSSRTGSTGQAPSEARSYTQPIVKARRYAALAWSRASTPADDGRRQGYGEQQEPQQCQTVAEGADAIELGEGRHRVPAPPRNANQQNRQLDQGRAGGHEQKMTAARRPEPTVLPGACEHEIDRAEAKATARLTL